MVNGFKKSSSEKIKARLVLNITTLKKNMVNGFKKSSSEKIKARLVEVSPWHDLPQDITELICNKLPCYEDQSCFRSVCKSWRISTVQRPPNYLPWTIHLPQTDSHQNPTLFDPCTDKQYKVLNTAHSLCKQKFDTLSETYFHHAGFDKILFRGPGEINFYYRKRAYASKYGWLLLLIGPWDLGWLILYNPFSDDVITLPKLPFEHCRAATFTTNPNNSPDCEVLVLCSRPVDSPSSSTDILYVARCCISSNKEWNIKTIGITSSCFYCQVHYMKEKLYFLLGDGVLKSYDLKDHSVELLSPCFPILADDRNGNKVGWLTENEGNLIAICRNSYRPYLWKTYKFDWLQNSLVPERLKNTTIFISDRVVTLAPLVKNDGEKLEDWRVCFFKDCYSRVDDYSMKEMKTISSKYYKNLGTICFIDPPYVQT